MISTVVTILTITAIICILIIIILLMAMLCYNIKIFFVLFKFENHKKIHEILVNKIYDICNAEGIRVYVLSFDELNRDNGKNEDAIVGKYVYTQDSTHQEKVNSAFMTIEELEKEHGVSFEYLCKTMNKNLGNKYKYALPRIMLSENLLNAEIKSYYSTFIHELGHHFALKKFGASHCEQDANDCALELIKREFPIYFQLIFWHDYTYNTTNKMKHIDKFKACIGYFKHVVKEKLKKV